MESIQALKTRMQSIGSTRQITQSMRLVSTAKVKKALVRMEANRPFFEQAKQMAADIVKNSRGSRHPYLKGREVSRSAVIIISSDRGLCGGYNINVGKEASDLIKKLGDARIIAVGTKAQDYCRRRNMTAARSFRGMSENPFYEDAGDICAAAMKMYDNKEVDQVYLVYTEYKSMLVQEAKSVRLLPLDIQNTGEVARRSRLMSCEPGEETFLERMTPKYLVALLYNAMLESAACEQSSRITSMDAAAKNSGEIIDSLSLIYNQARQGAITQELIEIVSGANALEQSERKE